jgi:hypothetical protein
MPPHLEEKFWRDKPPGTRVTPHEDLQVSNFGCDCEEKKKYPRWELFLEYWGV